MRVRSRLGLSRQVGSRSGQEVSFGPVPSDVPLRALSLLEDSTNTSAGPFHVLSQDVMLAAALDEIVFDSTRE